MFLWIAFMLAMLSDTTWAQVTPSPTPNKEIAEPGATDTLEKRVPIETLSTRSIGLVKRSAIFEWRKASIIADFHVGQPIEYNNFNSRTWGLDLRFPQSSSYLRIGISRTVVVDSRTSRGLRETPYYQAGRASRWEMSPAIELPIQEGIGNQLFSFIPPSQFVLAAVAELNFTFYHTNDPLFIKNIIKTRLTGNEQDAGNSGAPQSMKVSGARHDVGVGLQWDNYFASGFKWDYRTLFHLAPMAASDELHYWMTISFGAGYAF